MRRARFNLSEDVVSPSVICTVQKEFTQASLSKLFSSNLRDCTDNIILDVPSTGGMVEALKVEGNFHLSSKISDSSKIHKLTIRRNLLLYELVSE